MPEQALTAELLGDLTKPAAYPPPRPTAVRLVTTHLSWVFITDREVWKVKRPVDYGFVDYTTLDRRRHFCHEEVRLNRRLAPDVYVGVVPVRFDGERHAFCGPGGTIDYAVRMRRLPETASAETLLAQGTLTRDHLSLLARRLCALYATSRPASRWGSVDVIRANVTENFEQVDPYIGRFVDRDTFNVVRAWQLEQLTGKAATFATRQRLGRIREGHGDLRLGHVYFGRGEPIVIDAIEFNERFRMGDMAADVAFLAMELDARSRPDLAASFLAAVARDSGDYGLYTVVDFYLSYRAWVRGKVAAFRAADPSASPDEVRQKAREAASLFALARVYAGRVPLPPQVSAVGEWRTVTPDADRASGSFAVRDARADARHHDDVVDVEVRPDHLATVAHELRNPIAAIINALRVLERIGAPDARAARLRALMGRQAQHLTRLVEDVLDVARLRHGKLQLGRERVHLGGVIDAAVDALHAAGKADGHRIHIHCSPAPVTVNGDGTRLEQVVRNLLDNALKYSLRDTAIHVSIERVGQAVLLRVRDEGIGIDTAMLPRLFDPYAQAEVAGAHAVGLGLGLPLVRAIVEQHGGTITASSGGAGKGSEFVVHLPAEDGDDGSPEVDAGEPSILSTHRRETF